MGLLTVSTVCLPAPDPLDPLLCAADVVSETPGYQGDTIDDSCVGRALHSWVVLPGRGYWLATFFFVDDAQLGTTDPAVPESIVPVLGWRYCPQCNRGMPIVKRGRCQVYADRIVDEDDDSVSGTDIELTFHSNEPTVDSAPPEICETARTELAWAAARHEKQMGRSYGSFERVQAIRKMWEARARNRPPTVPPAKE